MNFDQDLFAQKLEEKLNQKVLDIIKRYDELGLRSSGRFADEIRSEVEVGGYMTTGRIWAPDYIFQMAFGRKPGTWPNIGKLKAWIEINGTPDGMTEKKWLGLVAGSLFHKGSEIWRNGGTDLLEATITKEWIHEMMDMQREAFHDQAVKLLRNQLRQSA